MRKSPKREVATTPGSYKRKIAVLSLGVLACFVVLEIGLRVVGFVTQYAEDDRNRRAADEGGTYRILCIGESTTFMGGEYSYPRQLEQILNDRSEHRRFAVMNGGIPGADTTVILHELESNLDRYRPHLLVAMMGANDIGGAIPRGFAVPETEEGFFEGLKTVKLFKLMWFSLTRDTEEDHLPPPPPPAGPRRDFRPPWGDAPLPCGRVDPLNYFDPSEATSSNANIDGPLAMKDESNAGYPFDDAGGLAKDGDYAGAEALLTEAVSAAPKSPSASVDYGLFLMERGRMEEARSRFQTAVELDPRWTPGWLGLARSQTALNEPRLAEEAFAEALKVTPESVEINMEMGSFLAELGRNEDAVERFLEATRLEPKFSKAYWRAARCLTAMGRAADAEALLIRAVEIRGSCLTYTRLVDLLEAQERDEDVEAHLAAGLERFPKDACLADLAGRYFMRRGEPERARLVYKSAIYYPPKTRYNFERLQGILAERGIKLVVAQYPGRNLQPLMDLFTTTDGIAFVDNETTFRRAMASMEYSELFQDNCYRDFGHATPLGNRMLAEEVAEVIMSTID